MVKEKENNVSVLDIEHYIFKIGEMTEMLGYLLRNCYDTEPANESKTSRLYDLEQRFYEIRLFLNIIHDLLYDNHKELENIIFST